MLKLKSFKILHESGVIDEKIKNLREYFDENLVNEIEEIINSYISTKI